MFGYTDSSSSGTLPYSEAIYVQIFSLTLDRHTQTGLLES